MVRRDSPLWFGLQIVGAGVLCAWIYRHIRESLLSVSLFHAAANTAVGVLPILPLDAADSIRPLLDIARSALAGRRLGGRQQQAHWLSRGSPISPVTDKAAAADQVA